MNVTVISIFRQAAHYLERYCEQMDDLQRLLSQQGHSLYLLLGYGDSTDGTGEALWDEVADRFPAMLLDVSHGGPSFGSIEHPERFKQLATIGNRLLACVPPNADVVGIVESDLIWDALTLSDLIAHLTHVPAIAPMVMDGPDSFYDIFAFRKGGVRFIKTPPYHEWLDGCCELVQLDSAGSVLFVRADLARKARLHDGNAIVGFSQDIYNHGGSVWLDTTLSVSHHPYDGKQRPADYQPHPLGLLRH
jgi:hypothetical protein